jgi:KDO2-lipid IV(A) lauroyltransferase
MNKTSNIGNRVVLDIILSFNLISRIVPLRIWLFFGKCFGLILYLIDPHHRRIVMINLKFAYGEEKNEEELKAIARSNFVQYGIMGFEWLRLKGLTRSGMDKLKRHIHVEGEENLIAAKKKNRSVILLSAHFGNWEYAHLYFADTFNRVNFIVRRIDNPLLEEERVAYNQRFGVNILYKENGLRPAIKNLKNGEDLIIFSDRKADLREGIPCLFFNQKTSTIPIIYTLAKKYQIPIVPMFIFRTEDITKHRIVFYPELNIDGMDMTEATQHQNNIIEKAIREFPAQWLWIHRKWKCYHEDIYK